MACAQPRATQATTLLFSAACRWSMLEDATSRPKAPTSLWHLSPRHLFQHQRRPRFQARSRLQFRRLTLRHLHLLHQARNQALHPRVNPPMLPRRSQPPCQHRSQPLCRQLSRPLRLHRIPHKLQLRNQASCRHQRPLQRLHPSPRHFPPWRHLRSPLSCRVHPLQPFRLKSHLPILRQCPLRRQHGLCTGACWCRFLWAQQLPTMRMTKLPSWTKSKCSWVLLLSAHTRGARPSPVAIC
mmetsp:Transcript_12582/g.24848  ORF Transcript_12582/g.24848 Transcript_12582/m.24848 type:complete len:240 (+) Transcript_12582:1343-2062(+)